MRRPTQWELEQRELQRKAEEKARQRRRKAFVKKWTSATSEKQANIIFDLMENAEHARASAARANLHNMLF